MPQLPTKLTQDYLESLVVHHEYNFIPNTSITVCTLFLQNGAKIMGKNYGSIDSNNQDWELAKQYAYKDAFDQLWELEGYLLRQRMFEQYKNHEPVLVSPELKSYVGVKLVHAKPMTGDDYKALKGLQTTPEIKANDQGYWVQYQDGYTSWCPKEVFEQANTCIEGQFDFSIAMLCHKAGAKVTRPHHITRSQMFMPKSLKTLTAVDLGATNWSIVQ